MIGYKWGDHQENGMHDNKGWRESSAKTRKNNPNREHLSKNKCPFKKNAFRKKKKQTQ